MRSRNLAVASGDAPDIGLQQVVATGLERQAQPRVELRAFEAPRVIPRLQGEGVAPCAPPTSSRRAGPGAPGHVRRDRARRVPLARAATCVAGTPARRSRSPPTASGNWPTRMAGIEEQQPVMGADALGHALQRGSRAMPGGHRAERQQRRLAGGEVVQLLVEPLQQLCGVAAVRRSGAAPARAAGAPRAGTGCWNRIRRSC
ncbi:Uncharacterised protein [Pseudomonas aeruginosa]|nr:Uncharacterised protein [Pseudomonas aeruginosa]